MPTDLRDAQGDTTVALRIEGLSKTFPGTKALDDVSFDVRRGTVHALLGGNGSGKSTLIKILAGVESGDAGGELRVNGTSERADHTTPEWAKANDVHFVHQNPGIFPDLTVAENIAIGRGFETGVGGRVDWSEVRRRAAVLIDRFEITNAKPDTPVVRLSPADQTMVAIARALQDQEDDQEAVLILDEPTTALSPQEVDRLLDRLRRYAAAGQTIVYVTHRLDEIIRFADRCTVLRDGRLAATVDTAGLTEADLVELIVGRPLVDVYPEPHEPEGRRTILEVRGLSAGPVTDVSFSLREGEVLGIAGLLGSGRSELLQAIFGALPSTGEIVVDGSPTKVTSVRRAMRAGIAYVPEDRGTQAAFLPMSVRENLSAANVPHFWRRLRLQHGQEGVAARNMIEEFLIKAHSDGQPINTLSGGNQQKCILARWMWRKPKVLLLDEPTQGVDVGARAEIYSLVDAAVRNGAAAIVVTSDFEELARVCDRVIVLAGGRITAELTHSSINPQRLTELAFGPSQPSVLPAQTTLDTRKELP